MPEPLPVFKYHPDPVAAGMIAESDSPCLDCNQIRGYIYNGPVYSERFDHLTGCLCPWCIADGSAAKRFGATFTDTGTLDGISSEVREELEQRTPGFDAWQQEQWLACCSDGAAFLGLAGFRELKNNYPKEALEAVRNLVRDDYELTGKDLREFLEGLTKDGEPTAYIFRCLHCKQFLAYADEA
jgi:uncharacterized protein